MNVIKHIISSGEKYVTKYPAVWGTMVPNLNEDIEFYEIQESDKPVYNELQFDIIKTITLTNTKGEFLNKAIISWEIVEKSQDEVIIILNKVVGEHIDNLYPKWEQNKHNGRATRYIHKLITNTTITEDEQLYINWIESLANWATKCRNDRDLYETQYLTTGVLPDLIFDARPIKPF